jgi:hypothetical protein
MGNVIMFPTSNKAKFEDVEFRQIHPDEYAGLHANLKPRRAYHKASSTFWEKEDYESGMGVILFETGARNYMGLCPSGQLRDLASLEPEELLVCATHTA